MSSALALRRRAMRALGAWDPSQITGLVGYWNAEDLTGAAGSAVSSWTDRKSGITVTQAVGTQQPTIVTNSGGTGKKALRFTAANNQIMTAALGSIPAQGPLWVWWVSKLISNSATRITLAEAGVLSDTSKGWAAGLSAGGNVNFDVWPATNRQAGVIQPTGNTYWVASSFDPVTGQQFAAYRNAKAPVKTIGTTANAVAGATTFAIGGSVTHPTTAYASDNELQILLVGSGVPPSADLYKMSAWLYANYGLYCGTAYNAPASVAVAGKDRLGNAVSNAVELGVVYNPAGLFGHKFWIGFNPYDTGGPDENPNLNFSDDGNTWSAGSISNPLVPYPGGGSAGNLADVALFDNSARDGLLYVLYVTEAATATNGAYIGSYDGATYTDRGRISTIANVECPVMVYDSASSQYWLYTMDISGSPKKIFRQTASSPTASFGSTGTQCTINGMPAGVDPWHISAPIKVGSKWVMSWSDVGATNRNVWIASSTDGLTWTVSPSGPVVIPSLTNWDNQNLYRPAIVDAGDGSNMLLWYIGGTGGAGTGNKVSQMVTVPYSVIP